MAIKKSDLYSSLLASCDELRGGMDASQYKDYVLFMLFIKYVSDKYGNSSAPAPARRRIGRARLWRPAPGARGRARAGRSAPWSEVWTRRVQGVTNGVSVCSPSPGALLTPTHPNPAEPTRGATGWHGWPAMAIFDTEQPTPGENDQL
jgi:hypothetical protein